MNGYQYRFENFSACKDFHGSDIRHTISSMTFLVVNTDLCYLRFDSKLA